MSMTLEQAIRILHPVGEDECATDDEFFADLDQIEPALLLACEVMQREVERGKGCEFCNTARTFEHVMPHEFCLDGTALLYYDPELGLEGIVVSHCPKCGKPLKDGKV